MPNLIATLVLLLVIAVAGKSCVDSVNEQRLSPAEPSQALKALAAKCRDNPDWCARVSKPSGGCND